MDLSKLPKMGNSPPPPQNAGDPARNSAVPDAQVITAPRDREIHGPESFIAIALGVIFMLVGLRFGKWAITVLTGGTFNTGSVWSPGTPNAGQPVAYWDLQGYVAYTEAGVFLFGLAMVVEGIMLAMFLRSRTLRMPAVLAAIALSVVATAFNAYVAGIFFSNNAGLPLFSLIAVAFGVYIIVYQWRILRAIRASSFTGA